MGCWSEDEKRSEGQFKGVLGQNRGKRQGEEHFRGNDLRVEIIKGARKGRLTPLAFGCIRGTD